jgi:hypothetical protein
MNTSLLLPLSASGLGSTEGVRLRSDLDLREALYPFLVWLAVTVCTLGLGWLVVSNHFFRALINSTSVIGHNGAKIGRLRCAYDAEKDTKTIAIWLVVSLATMGAGLLFYSFIAARAALNATEVEWL